PGVTGSLSGLSWQLGVLLPGLVSSGAALLFGVNALALDGAGALWRDSLPCPPRTLLLARTLVVAEVCAASTVIALAAAAARTPSMPTPAELAATAGALIACTAQVVGMCVRWSVLRPYPASLRGSRDQPAPPGTMAWYSARLAVSTTVTGLLFVLLGRSGSVAAVTSATFAVSLFTARRLMGLLRTWDDPAVRSRALVTVVATTA
ncbi:MAG TPA: hypothetical protein VHN80_20620, partial [Kineosporiaceae bacterium]|nr:hypothetical protein [Kineosporiaceae bacterium]